MFEVEWAALVVSRQHCRLRVAREVVALGRVLSRPLVVSPLARLVFHQEIAAQGLACQSPPGLSSPPLTLDPTAIQAALPASWTGPAVEHDPSAASQHQAGPEHNL